MSTPNDFKPFATTVKATIKIARRNGILLEAPFEVKPGTKVTLSPVIDADGRINTRLVKATGEFGHPEFKDFKVFYEKAGDYFKGCRKVPSINTLAKKMENECACHTIVGNEVEPDGYDEHGFPSFALIVGAI